MNLTDDELKLVEAINDKIADLKLLAAERDNLKRQLVEAEKELTGSRLHALNLQEHLDEARAEAAALRAAVANTISRADECDEVCEWLEAIERALSQPGHGAAYQERTRKLEAVAEAARAKVANEMEWAAWGGSSDKVPPSQTTFTQRLYEALTALEEKP